MSFTFTAVIYKVGINPCVDVPEKITRNLHPTKGYIPIKGKINQHLFKQTLVAVKNGPFRLYVNGPMMKGAVVKVGDTAKFTIEQDESLPAKSVSMNSKLKERLEETKLNAAYNALIPSRQKEINKYLNHLKTDDALERNIEKVILNLKLKVKN